MIQDNFNTAKWFGGAAWLIAAMQILAGRSNAQPQANWAVTITNGFLLAQAGDTIVFGGSISNRSGAALRIRDASLFVNPQSASAGWLARFSSEFLATDLSLSTNGFQGPLFSIAVPATATNASGGWGYLELELDPATLPPLNPAASLLNPVTLHIGFLFNPPALRIRRNAEDVELSWPAVATNFVLETTSEFTPLSSWKTMTNQPGSLNFYNVVFVTNGQPCQFFRLKKN